MIHARDDYNRMQDPEGKIGADEPVCLFRAQDKHFIGVLKAYRDLVNSEPPTEGMLESIDAHIALAEQWQAEHGSKVPDLPQVSKPWFSRA